MSWLVYRWLLLYGLTLFVFKGCQSLFLRHTQSGKCIAAGNQISDSNNARSYWVEMVNNCLNVSAQFRYLDTELLQNIKTGGTLASNAKKEMKFLNRLFIYYGKNEQGKTFQGISDHHLKQTDAGSLFLYEADFCVQPTRSFVDLKKDGCSDVEQNFTFGSVTHYGTKMKDVHCSPKQYMMVKRADYGHFNKTGFFNYDKNIDTTCSKLTNCQVKSRCGGKRSCELTMDNNLLPSEYCPDTSKEIYTEYTCVDGNRSTIITAASNIRLTALPYRGFIEIKHGSTWRYVNEKNWDKIRQKMLCQHLGFRQTDANFINTYWSRRSYKIATGDLICYNTLSSGTSCCTHLVPSTNTSYLSYVRCKICDNPLLNDARTFPDSVFSGNGDRYSRYKHARITKGGWCASGSAPYLLIDLQKEYHITRVVVMGNKDQTQWSESYSMKYSHNKTLVNTSSEIQITGNQNGYQASATLVEIYNVRRVKMQSTGNTNFCLRIELCGKVQTPAPVYEISITPYERVARVTWRIRTAPEDSSYITKIIIYLNRRKYETISRGTQIVIKKLVPNTRYQVEIETEDGSSQKSKKVSGNLNTKEADEICDKPLLEDIHRTFPNKVFSGTGGPNDCDNARFTGSGWCPSRSGSYLLLDLQKEYHITRVAVMGDRDQTKWSESYSMKYSHDNTLVDKSSAIQITGNQNGHEASTTDVGIYNVRYIKIQSTGNTDFCLRIELCGEVQNPAPVYEINITRYERAALVTWRIRTAPEDSSYITKIIIYLNRRKYETISRGTQIDIKKLEPNTSYQVEIETEDGSSQKSGKVSRNLNTKKAGEICDKPLLEDIHRTFPNKVFSGSGGSNDYQNARFTGRGWCPSRSGSYLSLDLQKEYHITRVAVMGDRDQTKWSESYSMKYSHDKTLVDKSSAIEITGNQNGHEASITDVGIYNVRYIKIQSIGNTDFCLRIELCGEVQKPASVYDIKITPSNTSAQVTLGNPSPDTSSYITRYRIELNGSYLKRIRRQEPRTEFSITGLTPFTNYTVRIWAGDGSSQWISSTDIIFMTNTSVPSGAPELVAFTTRSRNKLTVSWSAPSKNLRNGKLTGYRVCYSDKANSNNPSCFQQNYPSNSAQINNLQSATKYFVTVAAATSAGYGPKSMEIIKITNGESVDPVATSYSSLNITIMKPATYIKEVMIVVELTPKNRGVENIGKSDLKPYHTNTKDPYVTAYLKAEVLPQTFVIGDGNEYNSEKQNYSNQPLEQNSSYIAFLRFFESQESYYSTRWSNIVNTFAKPPVSSGSPWNVTITKRSKNKLSVSWRAPDQSLQTDELTGYKVCYSDKARSSNSNCSVCYSDKVRSRNPSCFQENDQSYTTVIKKLRPATKYFVTVTAGTSGGYGPKSAEISKITNGERVDPVATSYSSLNITIIKPATYIKEVMIIVQVAPKNRGLEEIGKSDLKPYQENMNDPYVTAYLNADVLPLTFVIGDGKEYNSEKEKYFNQVLEHNSNYIVFLRFFESRDSYYSTEWSSVVKTMVKPGLSGPPLNVTFNSRGRTSLQVSWKAPDESLQNVELTGYQVCFYTRDTAPECLVLASSKVLSLTLDNLKPSTKYFVTVSASTKAGYGEKSSEVSKITSGEPVNPLTTSDYTLCLNIRKPAEYIREVVVIVQIVTNGQTPSENIKTSKLKPYQTKTQDPYITAYLKADVLPLTFVIGDGKMYSSEKEKYINQPLEENSNYIVFLRFFESQDSYYSTECSKSVKTMKKRREQSSANNNTRLDFIIPLVILALCLLLSLAVIVYQRRRLQNNNRKESHKLTLRQADQTGTSDSKKSMEVIELTAERVSYVTDDTVYETPDDVIESIERNEAESKHEISTEEETSAYISLTDNKEPENFYQPVQTLGTSAHPHDTKGVDNQSAFNLNVSAV